MDNYLMQTADRLTHITVVVLALIAGIVVVSLGIAARPIGPDISMQLKARVPVLDASAPVVTIAVLGNKRLSR